MMYRTCRLPWRNSFPRSGSCCVSNNPRGFLYLSAGYCCHWQDWPTCKVSSPKKKKKKKDGKQECIYRRSCLLCTSYKVIS